MSAKPGPPEDWDRLREALPPGLAPPAARAETRGAVPGRVLLLASALGDLVSIVTVTSAGLLALRLVGHPAGLVVLPWACSLALCWWLLSAIALLAVRRGTPGMLVAGLGFAQPVPHRRLAPVLLLALILASSLGLLAALGLSVPLLRLAAGSSPTVAAPE